MVTLKADRILISPLSVADTNFLFKLMNTPKWKKYIGDRNIKNPADAKTYLKSSILPSYQKYGFGLFGVRLRATDQPMGICGFLQRDYLPHPDLGFAILPDFERKGYIHEAADLLLANKGLFAIDNKVLAITTPENHASVALLEKLGFIQKGNIPTDTKEEVLLLEKEL
ncbi:GNAT family N-acetyltransferase [uncultured Croceitalea sp.]|uniref:GNAT family N-acetyltransferase n=1 Tax=uncultured Croceitalea sp. TaxID=1798908 RepID=UPI0033056B93